MNYKKAWNKLDFTQKTILAWYVCRKHIKTMEETNLIKELRIKGFRVSGWKEWIQDGNEDFKIWNKKWGSDWRGITKNLLQNKL